MHRRITGRCCCCCCTWNVLESLVFSRSFKFRSCISRSIWLLFTGSAQQVINRLNTCREIIYFVCGSAVECQTGWMTARGRKPRICVPDLMTILSANRNPSSSSSSGEHNNCIGDSHMCNYGIRMLKCRSWTANELSALTTTDCSSQHWHCVWVHCEYLLQVMHDRVSLLNNPSNAKLINTRRMVTILSGGGTGEEMHNSSELHRIADVSLLFVCKRQSVSFNALFTYWILPSKNIPSRESALAIKQTLKLYWNALP